MSRVIIFPVHLHSAIGYITPFDKLQGHEQIIFAEKDRKLNEAREQRRIQRKAVDYAAVSSESTTYPVIV